MLGVALAVPAPEKGFCFAPSALLFLYPVLHHLFSRQEITKLSPSPPPPPGLGGGRQQGRGGGAADAAAAQEGGLAGPAL